MGFSRERYEQVLDRVARAAEKAGRTDGDICVVAVSKTQPAGIVAEAIEAGVPVLGENRVQEARDKREEIEPELATRAKWHLIGTLQRNKARMVPGLFDVVESIDSMGLAQELDKRVERAGTGPMEVFVEVNTGDEPQKGGASKQETLPLVESIGQMSSLRVVGLMCIPPLGRSPEESRPHFQVLRQLRDQALEAGHATVCSLSMGMSADFEVAIEEGATHVRIGTAIFGPRSYP
jgi:pyridoxal phosphate enzyme (YggS family)